MHHEREDNKMKSKNTNIKKLTKQVVKDMLKKDCGMRFLGMTSTWNEAGDKLKRLEFDGCKKPTFIKDQRNGDIVISNWHRYMVCRKGRTGHYIRLAS